MKTIIIQNNVVWTGKSKFKVTVNGEEHIMNDKFLYIDVDDNAPVELKAKRGWYSSSVYKFEPKDNLKLQILLNQRLQHKVFVWVLIFVLIFFAAIIFIECFFEIKRASSFLALSTIIFPLADLIIVRKKYFIISEK